MKNRLLSVIAVILISSSNTSAQVNSWYKEIKGTIGKYPVTIHLHKYGPDYSGYYYYESKQIPIYFNGDDTTDASWIRLIAWLPDRETDETLSFMLGDSVLGNWRNSETAAPLAFRGAVITDTSKSYFDYVFTQGIRKLQPKLDSSPTASYTAGSIWPRKNAPRSALLKKWIGELFGNKNLKVEIDKLLLDQKNQFFADYIEENKELKETEIKELGYSLNMEESSRLLIVYHSYKLLTLAYYTYSYSGGAHGNHGTDYSSYDLLNNKKLRLTDLLTADGRLQLPKLLEKYFRKEKKLRPNEALTEGGLFENTIGPNDNFYVTGNGIGFSYVPYEIAAYAAGEINVFIPLIELNKYLTPLGKKIMEEK